jgi:SEC-C motif-containing protein
MPSSDAPEAAGACPCGSGAAYDRCCGRLHRGEADAGTAEQLMRSRYAAFAVGDDAYLLASWHRSTRPPLVALDPSTEWLGLDVLATARGRLFDDDGTVEFVAHYRHAGRPGVVHEVSRFVRDGHRWRYVGPA